MRAGALIAIALATCGACGHGPRRVGGQPSWRSKGHLSNQPISLTTTGPAVTAYNDPPATPPPPGALGDAIMAEVSSIVGQAPAGAPTADGRLYAAASELASVVPVEGVVPYPLVEFALQHHGIIEPSPHLLVVWGPIDQPAVLVEELRPQLQEVLADGDIARVGIGAARRDDGDVVVVALQPSHITTGPIPRQLAADGGAALSAHILNGFSEPEVFMTRTDGGVERIALTEGPAGAIAAELRCHGRGREQVEITASDQTGSTVLANFPIWCGETPPDHLTAAGAGEDGEQITSAADAEARMFELINRDRAAAGLPAFELDPQVADVARAHSHEMHATGVVGHVSATTGTAADRLKAAGIRTGLVLENIARAYGVGEAEDGLMNSPGHRANLMSTGATHVGIGIELGDEVSGRRELFVTQLFIRIPPAIDATAAQRAIRERLHAARAFSDDAGLDRIATDYAAALAAGTSHDDAARAASRALDQVGNHFARVASMVTAVTDLSAIDPETLLSGATFTHVGIGVAQGDHPDLGPGALHVVILLGQARPGH